MQAAWKLVSGESPSLYVNADLLPPAITNAKDEETHTCCYDDRQLVEFELYAERISSPKMYGEHDKFLCTPESESDEESNKTLPIILLPVQGGYIVKLTNDAVYLSEKQWNTLIDIDRLVQCAVCDRYMDYEESLLHSTEQNHRENLAEYPPLHEFEYSITRKIGNKYHCGVCNSLYNEDDSSHTDSKMHEGNKLFACNKAIDLLSDEKTGRAITKKQNYHFKTHDMNPQNNSYNYKAYHDSAYSNAAKEGSYHTETKSNCNGRSDYKDYEIFSNNNFIDFRCNDDDDDYDEASNPSVSYANIAKTPKVHVDNVIEIEFANKKVKVKYDSWNMVRSVQRNNFHCMACNKSGHARHKVAHCSQDEHRMRLANCQVVLDFEDFFIRQVDDKLYHCGHCNNLQFIIDMEAHIESWHPRKNKPVRKHTDSERSCHDKERAATPVKKNNSTATPEETHVKRDVTPVKYKSNDYNRALTPVKNDISKVSNNDRNVTVKNMNGISPKINDSNINVHSTVPLYNGIGKDTVPSAMAGILDTIRLHPFGYTVTIPVMSYNVVCKRVNDYYCGICDKLCSESDIHSHIYQISHIELLQRTPFIEPYKYNLIRAIREKLHCTICNMPITVHDINEHINNEVHVSLVTKALGYHPNSPPTPNLLPGSNPHQNWYRPAPIGSQLPQIRAQHQTGSHLSPTGSHLSQISPTGSQSPRSGSHLSPTGSQLTPTVSQISPPGSHLIPPVPILPQIGKQMSPNSVITGASMNTQNIPTSNLLYPLNIDLTKPPPNYIPNIPYTRNGNLIEIPLVNKVDHQETVNDLKEKEKEEEENLHEEEISEEYEMTDEEEMDATFESIISEEPSFDLEEYVYVKLKNTFIKISNASYNSLVHIGDGDRYCFVCVARVELIELQKHVDSRPHLENMEKYRFLSGYDNHLLRQFYLTYHCGICNVILNRKNLKWHLDWPTHSIQIENMINKKTRKTDMKSGIKQIIVSTQPENIYTNDKVPDIQIVLDGQLSNGNPKVDNSVAKLVTQSVKGDRKNKIISSLDSVLKISWESWHGVAKIKSGFRCLLCQKNLEESLIDEHCSSEWHNYSLVKPLEKQYKPALIRKINDTTLNCLICNTEISNQRHLATEHIKGKKHMKNYDLIWAESSKTNTYSDCDDDVLLLDN